MLNRGIKYLFLSGIPFLNIGKRQGISNIKKIGATVAFGDSIVFWINKVMCLRIRTVG